MDERPLCAAIHVCMIDDNLATHISVDEAELAVSNNNQVRVPTCISKHSTHLLQPPGVAVFRSVQVNWRNILENFRRESRITGPLPMVVFRMQLFQLLTKVSKTVYRWESAFWVPNRRSRSTRSTGTTEASGWFSWNSR